MAGDAGRARRPAPLAPGAAADRASPGVLAAYVAQVAHWLGSPGWATASVPLASQQGCWPRTPCSPWLSGCCSAGRAAGGAWAGRRLGSGPSSWRSASGPRPRPRRPRAVGWDGRRARARVARGRARRRPGRCDPARPGRRRAGARGRRPTRRRPARPARGPGSLGPRGSDRHPRPVGSRRRDRGAARLVPDPPAALRAAQPGPDPGMLAPPASARWRSPRGRRSTRGACGSRCSGPRGRFWRGLDRTTSNQASLVLLARWRRFGMLLDRRRRGGGGADRPRAGRRAQGGPSRLRLTPASIGCSTAARRASR